MADPNVAHRRLPQRRAPDPDAACAGGPATASAIADQGRAREQPQEHRRRIPLGKFVCITGVSGSGKSTLITEILYKKAAQVLYSARDRPGAARRRSPASSTSTR